MRKFCSLASGSQANSYFFSSTKTKLLIDAGLSLKATKERLALIGEEMEKIDAILISHEHSDHIAGIKSIASKYDIPIFANLETARHLLDTLDTPFSFKIFTTSETFIFQDIEIHPFSVTHDAVDPVGFTLTTDQIKWAILTDCGFATSLITHHLSAVNYLIIEANHEEHMVHACSRPPLYKQRVLGKTGHLSNEACADILATISHKDLKKVILAHLSQECNHPETAVIKAIKALGPLVPSVTIAPQNNVGEVIFY